MRLNILALSILILGLTITGCSQYQQTPQETPAPSETLISTTTEMEEENEEMGESMEKEMEEETEVVDEVTIQGFSFKPNSITIPIGTTVTWTNEDAATHTITSEENIFDSGNIRNGGTYSYTFNEAGTFKYYCKIHPTMRATVVVE